MRARAGRGGIALLAVLLALTGAAGAAAQGGEQRAGLVVQYGDGRVETACVRFSEPELSGVELLERSGLPVVLQAGGVGAAVCKIGPDGCDYPAEACFCRRDGARSVYWAFYTLEAGAWAYATLGAANTPARDGDVHGWAWGLGDSTSGAQPPPLDWASVCAPAQAGAPAATALPRTDPAETTAAGHGQTMTATSDQAMTATAGQGQPAAPAPPTAAPPVTPGPEPSAQGGLPASYLAFGALALLLGAGALALARRR